MLRITRLFPLFLVILIFSLPAVTEAGPSVLAVQSVRARPFDEAFEGFRSVLAPEVTVERKILSDTGAEVEKAIRVDSPDLILAIGFDALARLKPDKNIPIVYVMVMEADIPSAGRELMTGVTMEIDPEQQLAMLLDALPRTRRIGLLYDPEQTGKIVNKIRKAAEKRGVELLAGRIYRAKNVPLAFLEMKGKIDVYWMLPDLTVVTPETVEFLILSAMELNTPIISFSDKYVEQGAMMSISIDAKDMGRQAGEMAAKILAGADPASIPKEEARKPVLTTNPKIAGKLGIPLNDKAVGKAVVIR